MSVLTNRPRLFVTLAVAALTVFAVPALAETPAPGTMGDAEAGQMGTIYNVYAGLNLDAVQTLRLVATIDATVSQLVALQAGTTLVGPEYGMQMVVREPGAASDARMPEIDAVMDAYLREGVSITDQVTLLNARFGDVAEFSYGNGVVFSDAEIAAFRVIHAEWLDRLATFLTPQQMEIFRSNQAVIDEVVGQDWSSSVQIFIGSGGEPLVAPAG